MINPVIVEIRNLLAAAMTTRCVAYYVGDIGLPAKAQMPVCIVRRVNSSFDRRTSTGDYWKHTISILVVTDIIKSLSTAGLTSGLVSSENTLADIVAEMDTDGAPKTNTVLGTLTRQSNLRGTYYQYLQNFNVNYQPDLGNDFPYVAAEITFETESFVTRKS